MFGERNTSINPMMEKISDLLASDIFLSSPPERINLKPADNKDTTTMTTETAITEFMMYKTKEERSECPVEFNADKSKSNI